MGTDTTTTAAETGEPEITELVEFNPTRLDGVKSGANGFPFLLIKSAATADASTEGKHAAVREWFGELAKAMNGGQVDEAPDISTGRQIMTLLGSAIGAEAEELGAGHYGEVQDVRMLARAADMVSCWIAREKATAAGQDPDATCGCCEWCTGIGCGCCPGCGAGMVMCSAADEATVAAKASAEINDLPDSAFAHIEAGGKKDADGKTTPRSLRHFPVHDKEHAQKAVQLLSTSPFGAKAKPKVMAAAKKFGVEVDASKSAVAEGEPTVQDDAQGSDSVSKAVADAVTKATQPVLDRLAAKETELDGLLAKVKATPLSGGPVQSVTQPQKAAGVGDDLIAKAERYRQKATQITDKGLADEYLQLARECDDKAGKIT